LLVLRKNKPSFHSIENVFGALFASLNVETFELPYESVGLLNRLRNIRFLKKQETDFIHISGNDHYLLWWPFKNCILTVHDVESLNRKRGWKRWLFKVLWFDIPIRNAKIVTTISEASKKEILRLGNYKTPIRVIPNPITLPLKYSHKEFNKVRPRILHLGVKANKNLGRLIHSLRGISCELIIIGKATAKLTELLNRHKIQHCFKIGLTNQEVMLEYEKCDILAFVSIYEGFGLPIVEAQAAGRVVLTSNLSSMPEVAGEGALFVNPYSIDDIRAGILNIVNNKRMRESLIEMGCENVKRFQTKKISSMYTELYLQFLND